MKTKISLKRISVATITGSIVMLVLVPWIVGAQPSATPVGGNVEANFFSVKLPTGPKMTGSFGRYVGLAPATHGSMSGYTGAKTRCSSAFTDSHVCTASEIMSSIEHGVVGIPATGQAWINNGPPAYVTDVSNDCFGWTMNNTDAQKNNLFGTTDISAFGSTWYFTDRQAFMAVCNETLRVACCSY